MIKNVFFIQCLMLGVTCAFFFALAICHLTLYAQLSIGVGLADYCADPVAAQKSSLELPQCTTSLETLEQFNELIDGMHATMDELSNTVARPEFVELTRNLASLRDAIYEITLVKDCNFINEEASKITGELLYIFVDLFFDFEFSRFPLRPVHCRLVVSPGQFVVHFDLYRPAPLLRPLRVALV